VGAAGFNRFFPSRWAVLVWPPPPPLPPFFLTNLIFKRTQSPAPFPNRENALCEFATAVIQNLHLVANPEEVNTVRFRTILLAQMIGSGKTTFISHAANQLRDGTYTSMFHYNMEIAYLTNQQGY
jgi:hypothetical protein